MSGSDGRARLEQVQQRQTRITLKRIDRAFDTPTALVENMRVDHGRADIFVAEQFLHRSNIITALKKMSSEGCRNEWQLPGLVIPAA